MHDGFCNDIKWKTAPLVSARNIVVSRVNKLEMHNFAIQSKQRMIAWRAQDAIDKVPITQPATIRIINRLPDNLTKFPTNFLFVKGATYLYMSYCLL